MFAHPWRQMAAGTRYTELFEKPTNVLAIRWMDGMARLDDGCRLPRHGPVYSDVADVSCTALSPSDLSIIQPSGLQD